MGTSRVTVGLMIAITGCIGAPDSLFAADAEQQQAPGYAAPDPNGPWTPIPDLAVPKPQADPPATQAMQNLQTMQTLQAMQPLQATPELSFRDRLKLLDTVGAATQMQPGFTTKDTTSSYSASAGPSFTTQNTTSSFTAGPAPKP
jgi:hypothetical protein